MKTMNESPISREFKKLTQIYSEINGVTTIDDSQSAIVIDPDSTNKHVDEYNNNEKENTQLVWERILSKPSQADVNSHLKSEEDKSLTRTSNPNSVEDQSTTNPASEAFMEENERHKILDFICYRSYELIDLKSDEIWKQIASKSGFKNELWMDYKRDFFDDVTKNSKLYPDLFNFVFQEKDRDENADKTKSTSSSSSLKVRTNIFQSPLCSKELSSDVEHRKIVRRNSLQYDSDNDSNSNSSDFCSRNTKSPRYDKYRISLGNSQSREKCSEVDKENDSKDRISLGNSQRREKCSEVDKENDSKDRISLGNSQSREKSSEVDKENDSEKNSIFSNISRRMNRKRRQQCDKLRTSINTDQLRNKTNNTKEIITNSNRNGSSSDDSVSNPCGDNSENSKDLGFSSDSSVGILVMDEVKPQPNKIRIISESSSDKCIPVITSNQSIAPRFSLFSNTRRRPNSIMYKNPRSNYLSHERLAILKYIQAKSIFIDTIKGNTFWKEMEASNACPGRTWQSLRNHFFKSLIHDIYLFDLNEEFVKTLKLHCNKK